MDVELYEELCEELEVPKHYECFVEEHDCLLSLGYGVGEMSHYCAKAEVPPQCDFRSKEEVFPKFTAEKQGELIKFLIRQDSLIIHYIYTEKAYGIACTVLPANEQIFVKEEDFTDALLAFIFKIVCFSKKCTKPIIDRKELIDIIEKGKIR